MSSKVRRENWEWFFTCHVLQALSLFRPQKQQFLRLTVPYFKKIPGSDQCVKLQVQHRFFTE
jgi:hypothetical protein